METKINSLSYLNSVLKISFQPNAFTKCSLVVHLIKEQFLCQNHFQSFIYKHYIEENQLSVGLTITL